MPDANTLTVGLFAVIAQHERETISQRTKDALQAKKARGAQLGTPANLTEQVRQVGLATRQRNAREHGVSGKPRRSSWRARRRSSAASVKPSRFYGAGLSPKSRCNDCSTAPALPYPQQRANALPALEVDARASATNLTLCHTLPVPKSSLCPLFSCAVAYLG